jgi:hypothetical protein
MAFFYTYDKRNFNNKVYLLTESILPKITHYVRASSAFCSKEVTKNK